MHGEEEAEIGVMMWPQAKDSRIPAAPGAGAAAAGSPSEPLEEPALKHPGLRLLASRAKRTNPCVCSPLLVVAQC